MKVSYLLLVLQKLVLSGIIKSSHNLDMNQLAFMLLKQKISETRSCVGLIMNQSNRNLYI